MVRLGPGGRAASRASLAVGQALGKRKGQEDSYAVGSRFVVIADGMGGHSGGEVASGLAVRTVSAQLAKARGGQPSARLRRAAEAANAAIRDRARDDEGLSGMGTTLVAVQRRGRRLYWVSVGDSLLWLYRDGELWRLNADHSMREVLNDQVRDGMLSEADARVHPYRNSLRSFLGDDEIALIDCPVQPLLLRPGDLIVVATDGVETLVRADIEYLLSAAGSPQAAVDAMLAAIARVGRRRQDNTTVAVWRPRDRALAPTLLGVALLIAAAACCGGAVWLVRDQPTPAPISLPKAPPLEPVTAPRPPEPQSAASQSTVSLPPKPKPTSAAPAPAAARAEQASRAETPKGEGAPAPRNAGRPATSPGSKPDGSAVVSPGGRPAEASPDGPPAGSPAPASPTEGTSAAPAPPAVPPASPTLKPEARDG